MVPTAYVRSVAPWSGVAAAPLQPETITQTLIESLWAMHIQQNQAGCGFSYPSADSFAAQFIFRPLPVSIWRNRATDDVVIFEHSPDTDRLLFVGGEHADPRAIPDTWTALAAWAGARDRKFFGFAIHPEHCGAAEATELDRIPGFLCVNAAAPDTSNDPGPGPETLQRNWVLQSGDRM
ncbi:MAG: hypothetical protein KGO50_06920 [Myxococcales bacterium]|nr:hypothetical protein [Myxococcales bacterium]